jgi:lipopolysaccharide/colanic/teichoic acid biosynthesis glycosyltransferase
MRGDRRPDPKELVPLAHPDITPIGRWLRRFKLDELPQLFNVIQGEMALVGPRPTLPDQVAKYDEFRRQRLLVRPGLTGLAQVYSSASASWEERILYDIAYVRNCRFLMDLLILWRTPVVMLFGEERTRRPFLSSRFARSITVPPGFLRDHDVRISE